MLDFTKKKNEHVFKEFLEYVANEHGSWFFMKGAPQAPFMKHVVKVGQCEVYDLHEPNPMTWIEGVLQYLYIDTATIKSRLVVSFPNKLNIHLPKIDCQRRVVTTLEEISEEFDINLTPTNVTLSQACQQFIPLHHMNPQKTPLMMMMCFMKGVKPFVI